MTKYDDETRNVALDCLAANEGDYQATSTALGISETTLRRWAKRENSTAYGDATARLQAELAAFRTRAKAKPATAESAGDDMRAWLHNEVLPHLIEGALLLVKSIPEVIAEASLSQRSTALNQVLDKILKLLDLLPKYGEQVLRVEYVDPDGTIHDTPHWARGDSE